MSLPGDGRKDRKDVTIKGTAGGLLIRLRDEADASNIEGLLVELEARLQQGAKFFRNAHVSVDLGRRELPPTDLEALQDLLVRYDMRLESIVSGVNATRSAARQAGVPIRLPSLATTRAPIPSETDNAGLPFDSAEALLVRRTLRSGQVLEHHSDVCLIGDVNPGAEIIAGGSIMVWGMLRGTVQSLVVAEKVKSATICALYFSPAQLRIGDLFTRGPELKNQPEMQPEMALVREGRIVVEPWTRHKF
jgi:septum site-determining protein MinC